MTEIRFRIGLLAFFVSVCVLYLRQAMEFRQLAAWAPLFAGSVALLIFGTAFLRDFMRARSARLGAANVYGRTLEFAAEDIITGETVRAMWRYLAWLLGLLGLVVALGLAIAGPLFIGLFLRLDARLSWRFTVTAMAMVIVILWFFGNVIGFIWPRSIFVNPY